MTMSISHERLPQKSELTDEALVERVLAGETELFAVVMRRHNGRLFRVTRAILRDEVEAEDALQQAYVDAFRNLEQFDGRARLSTWLTRIAIHQALARARGERRLREVRSILGGEPSHQAAATPEEAADRRELARVLEDAIDALPETYRMVVVMRDVEQMSTAEAAAALELSEENVRIRLHRARALLREAISERVGVAAADVFPFAGARCDRIVARVMEAILGA
jgi:RNA polymerase sigma-70 factor (ECF subfamily)